MVIGKKKSEYAFLDFIVLTQLYNWIFLTPIHYYTSTNPTRLRKKNNAVKYNRIETHREIGFS